MYCTGGTTLALHFLNENCLSKHILAALSSPLIYILRHWRRRSNRIDSGYFCEHIRDMCSSGVTIHCL